MTLHADCMPVLLCDPVRRVVATVHAGWRGTVLDVAGATVRSMTAAFGTDPSDVVVYLGPAIGTCCYEVGDEVVSAWENVDPTGDSAAMTVLNDRWRFDLARANGYLLERAGLRSGQIDQSGICTKCDGDNWFSHRGQGAATGRFGAFIALEPQ